MFLGETLFGINIQLPTGIPGTSDVPGSLGKWEHAEKPFVTLESQKSNAGLCSRLDFSSSSFLFLRRNTGLKLSGANSNYHPQTTAEAAQSPSGT